MMWEIRATIDGYRRRQREDWRRTRWETWWLLNAMPMVDIRKAGINSMSDLMKLPEDNDEENSSGPDEQEIADLRKMMEEMNAEAEAKKKENNDNENDN